MGAAPGATGSGYAENSVIAMDHRLRQKRDPALTAQSRGASEVAGDLLYALPLLEQHVADKPLEGMCGVEV